MFFSINSEVAGMQVNLETFLSVKDSGLNDFMES